MDDLTGDNVGDMQSEIKPSEFIDQVVCSGPKNYAYRLITNEGEKPVCKFSGITLNEHASKLVNFEVIKALFSGQGESVLTCRRRIRSHARGRLVQ